MYVPGVYYGILPSIINGMKVSDYQKHKSINSQQNDLNKISNTSWMSANADNINNDKEINFILIADLKNQEKRKLDVECSDENNFSSAKPFQYATSWL